MQINLVVAASENNVIGKDNKLLWCLPNDMRFFKNVTWAMPVIMGRKTYESLGKPLKGRTNIVITRQKDWKPEGTFVVDTMDKALAQAADTDAKQVYVIGGGEIYKQSMSIANRIYITRVHAKLEGDTNFPEIDSSWTLESRIDFEKDENHDYAYSFEVWTSAKTS